MTERPILFSGAMVRALLDGSKTQTRRVVKWLDLKPGINLQFSGLSASQVGGAWVLESPTRNSHEWRCAQTPCPYGTIDELDQVVTGLHRNEIPEGYVAIPKRMFADLMQGKYQAYVLSLQYAQMMGGNKP